MHRNIARSCLGLLLLFAASPVAAFSTGPPVSRTAARALGIYPGETSCTSCHSGGLNDPNGKIEIIGLPDRYIPGMTYPLHVRLMYSLADTATTNPKWGFELTAVTESDGLGAGTILLPPAGPGPTFPDSCLIKMATGGTFLSSNRQYLEQSVFSVRTDQPGPVEWPFSWVAPAGPAGRVFFFAAGNAANGNGNTSGDFIFTSVDSMNVLDPNAVPGTSPPVVVLLFAMLVGAGIVVARKRPA